MNIAELLLHNYDIQAKWLRVANRWWKNLRAFDEREETIIMGIL